MIFELEVGSGGGAVCGSRGVSVWEDLDSRVGTRHSVSPDLRKGPMNPFQRRKLVPKKTKRTVNEKSG